MNVFNFIFLFQWKHASVSPLKMRPSGILAWHDSLLSAAVAASFDNSCFASRAEDLNMKKAILAVAVALVWLVERKEMRHRYFTCAESVIS